MAARTKLLVIGLDAANGRLIRQWARQGQLPNFAALMERGRTATLQGVDGFFTGSTWPSLLTGTNPATHGIHYLVQIEPGTYSFTRPHEAEYIRAPSFWKPLSEAGKQLAILDVPLSKPDPSIRGIQTVEWAGHDSIFGFTTSPPTLAADILRKHGRHPVPSDCDCDHRTGPGYAQFIELLVSGIEAKTRVTVDLVGRDSWDLFLQVFTETHCVGHQCWHLHDPRHPAHDPAYLAAHGDPLLRVYQAIDRGIGEIMAAAGSPPTMVVSSHTVSHAIGGNLLLPQILERLGYAVPLPAPPSEGRHAGGVTSMARSMARLLPTGIKSRLKRALEREPEAGSFALPSLRYDWRATRCFVVPNGLAVSGIRLNLAGREPDGQVEPGAPAETLFEELKAALLEISDDRTGQPAVRRVVRTGDLYRGPNLERLPDILVEWHDAAPVGSSTVVGGRDAIARVRSPRIGVVEKENDYCRTGEHRGEGLLVAAGPGIAAGQDELTLSLLDVAPTLTAALGVTFAQAEGRAVKSMIPT